MKTIEQVRQQMDAGYANGTAYQSGLIFDHMRGEYIRKATTRLASSFDLATTKVLDVGCGQGGIATFWPHPENVVGIDISAVAIEKARLACPEARFFALPVEHVEQLPVKDIKLVVAQESIEHWVDVPGAMKALRSLLPSGGALVLTTPNRDSLHCRMSRKFGYEAPYCSNDHIHEFGYLELINTVESFGFRHDADQGVGLLPYWSMEQTLGTRVRSLTDTDADVNSWFHAIAWAAPASFAFIQCHRFLVS